MQLISLPRGTSTEDAIAVLSSDPAVDFAEPNLIKKLAFVPNDPRFVEQWSADNQGQSHGVSNSSGSVSGLSDADMNLPEAWDIEKGRSEVVIGILDSGIDVNHPDLASNIWINGDETPGNNIDDDRNGFIDDINGWDFAEDDASLLEADPTIFGWDHGTHVAGIAAGVGNNSTGISGVCPQCKIMALKSFLPFDTDGDGQNDSMIGTLAGIVKGLDYAIDEGASIVNASFGNYAWSRAERAAIRRATSAGIVFVAAAGNEATDNDLSLPLDADLDGEVDGFGPSFPSGYDIEGLVSVAASNDLDEHGYETACAAARGSRDYPCTFTNWGSESVHLSAPGVDILSSVPNAAYAYFDGTSMAAPAVSGVAGLIRSAHPDYSPEAVRLVLMNSVDRPASLESLFAFPGMPATGQFTASAGRVNALAALATPSLTALSPSDGSIRGARSAGRDVSGSVSWPDDTNDVVKTRLRRGRFYRVELDGPSAQDFDLLGYAPGVKDIWQIQFGCLTGRGICKVVLLREGRTSDEVGRFRAPTTGTYFFQVAAMPFSAGNYTLKITRV